MPQVHEAELLRSRAPGLAELNQRHLLGQDRFQPEARLGEHPGVLRQRLLGRCRRHHGHALGLAVLLGGGADGVVAVVLVRHALDEVRKLVGQV